MKSGIELISEERQEQIEKHGFDAKHDADYEAEKQLAYAAIYLLMNYSDFQDNAKYFPANWEQSWKIKFDSKSDIEGLRIAGALIAAEIDRLITQNKIG